MHPYALRRSSPPPDRDPSITGGLVLLVGTLVLVAALSAPRVTSIVILVCVLAGVTIKRTVELLMERFDGEFHTVHIPHLGRIEYRFHAD